MNKDLIPKGDYCYDSKSGIVCIYWEIWEDKPSQDNGFCHYLEWGDWTHPTVGLLWDQIKECGINEKEE